MAAKTRAKGPKESVLVLCAHSDDQIFGVGGSLAKYAEEGKSVITIIFSYGEKSHPWLKRKVTIKMRVKESQEAAKIIGVEKTMFLGIYEGRFPQEIEEKEIHDRIYRLIKKYRPIKIFTHAGDDPHPDHSAVNKFVLELCNEVDYKGDVYSYDVWNPLKIKERNLPTMYVDISKTFRKKIKALRCFESQWLSLVLLLWSVYWRAIRNGLKARTRFAEVFYKVR
jgi:LmbE family N-acetylglucosaminyl deacetylase